MGVTDPRFEDKAHHRPYHFWDFLSSQAILAGFITIGIYLSWRIISKLYVFNTAYIGLFDRSLLHMSLNQVELALKNTAPKLLTPVSMYKFDLMWIVNEK